jgi:hypothetical protein
MEEVYISCEGGTLAGLRARSVPSATSAVSTQKHSGRALRLTSGESTGAKAVGSLLGGIAGGGGGGGGGGTSRSSSNTRSALQDTETAESHMDAGPLSVEQPLLEQLALLAELRKPALITLRRTVTLDPATWPPTLQLYAHTTITGHTLPAARGGGAAGGGAQIIGEAQRALSSPVWLDLGHVPRVVRLHDNSAHLTIANAVVVNGCVAMAAPDPMYPEQLFLTAGLMFGVDYER